jgi:hypothetical protein
MQLGTVTIPDNPYRLPALLLDVAKIYQTYDEAAIVSARTDDKLAELLGYTSSHNGSFWNRLAALRAYRLVEGRPDIRLTELAKKLTTTENQVKKSVAYFEAVSSIFLWRQLYNRHKFNLPAQNLWKDLVEITDCTTKQGRSAESFVREAFEVDTNSIRTYNFEAPSGTMNIQVLPGTAQNRSQAGMEIEIKAGPYYHRLPFTTEGLRTAIEILKTIKAPDQQSKATPKPSA